MKYIFEHAQDQAELARLQLIEQLHDPRSRRLIEELRIPKDGHCLEVGPGAGSIMRWLARDVVADGRVTAIDLNTAFGAREVPGNTTLVQANLLDASLEPSGYDLIHGRFVVVFMPDYQETIAKLASALRPGGWLLLEEVDFTSATVLRASDSARQVFNAINRAILAMYTDGGFDGAFGRRLESLFGSCGLAEVQTLVEDAAGSGGSVPAEVMKRSTKKLSDAYLATGAVTAEQVESYLRLCDDPDVSLLHHRTVCAWGRRLAAG